MNQKKIQSKLKEKKLSEAYLNMSNMYLLIDSIIWKQNTWQSAWHVGSQKSYKQNRDLIKNKYFPHQNGLYNDFIPWIYFDVMQNKQFLQYSLPLVKKVPCNYIFMSNFNVKNTKR